MPRSSSEEGNNLCRLIKLMQVSPLSAEPWASRLLPALPGEGTAVLLAAAKLRCALWLVTMDFLPPRFTSALQFQ